MSFLAANRLWLLLLVVALLVAYILVQRQRRPYAVRFTNVDLLASVAPKHPGWRRHLAAACSLLALTILVMAFARPARSVEVPRETATVVLALDVSNSMKATDVAPNRFRAAQRAVATFVDTLPRRFRLGFITFANSVQVAVPPTHQRERVRNALGQHRARPRHRDRRGDLRLVVGDQVDPVRWTGHAPGPDRVAVRW